MIVMRLLMLSFGWLALLPMAGMVGAHAQDCGPAAIHDAYREGEAAFGRKDFPAAAALFRPLAEQGLGPAQLRLGQILGADGAGDPVEAFRWIALAVDIDTPGAKDQLDRLAPRLAPAQREQAVAAQRAWQPTLGPCLSTDPRKRPDGAPGYNFEAVINRVLPPASPGATLDRRKLDWLAHTLEIVRTRHPRALIYFKALGGIGFFSGNANVTIRGSGDQRVLLVDQVLTDVVAEDNANELIKAAMTAIHDLLVPRASLAESSSYKNRVIHTLGTDEGRRFAAQARQAIDLVDTLPADLAALGHAVTDLRYVPLQYYSGGGAPSAFIGEFRRDPSTGKRFMAYPQGIETRGPQRMALNLVAGGVLMRRAEQTGGVPQNDRRAQCELSDYVVRTMFALNFTVDLPGEQRVRMRQGCGAIPADGSK